METANRTTRGGYDEDVSGERTKRSNGGVRRHAQFDRTPGKLRVKGGTFRATVARKPHAPTVESAFVESWAAIRRQKSFVTTYPSPLDAPIRIRMKHFKALSNHSHIRSFARIADTRFHTGSQRIRNRNLSSSLNVPFLFTYRTRYAVRDRSKVSEILSFIPISLK